MRALQKTKFKSTSLKNSPQAAKMRALQKTKFKSTSLKTSPQAAKMRALQKTKSTGDLQTKKAPCLMTKNIFPNGHICFDELRKNLRKAPVSTATMGSG
jgi:hypothetical protein